MAFHLKRPQIGKYKWHSITYNLKYECFSMAFDQIVQVNQPFVLSTVVELVTITV